MARGASVETLALLTLSWEWAPQCPGGGMGGHSAEEQVGARGEGAPWREKDKTLGALYGDASQKRLWPHRSNMVT